MTRRRWIADQVSGNRAVLLGSHADHLARVLRARVGQEFDIATGVAVRRGRITTIENDRVEFELGEDIPSVASLRVTLALAIFKFDRMEWAIEKCTELGAACIVPVITRRTDAHLAAAATKRLNRWQRIARQASEQSRHAGPPDITSPIKVKEAVTLPGSSRILLAASSHEVLLKDALPSPTAGSDVVLAVGPEGGWTESEAELFQQAGWIAASLGSTILRAETAAIAAMAVLASELH